MYEVYVHFFTEYIQSFLSYLYIYQVIHIVRTSLCTIVDVCMIYMHHAPTAVLQVLCFFFFADIDCCGCIYRERFVFL